MSTKKLSEQEERGSRVPVALAASLIAALTLLARPAVLKPGGDLKDSSKQRAQEIASLNFDLHAGSEPSVPVTGNSTSLSPAREVTPQSPQYQGFHDGAGCSTIQGWAWDANSPNNTVNVDIYDGTNLIATTPANMYREDLLNALGSPYHGFSYSTPAALKDGAFHTVNVKFSGTNTLLNNTARTVVCSLGANLIGNHDGLGCNAIEGWAWDINDFTGTVNVDIYDGATLIGTVAATQYRQDLADAFGSPYHGFIFHTPASLKNGQQHTITVKYGGTNTPLPNSGIAFSCSGSTPNYQGSHDIADCNTISGYAWDANDDGGTINAAIYVDGGFRVVVPAQQVYPGIGGGYHGFRFAIPYGLKDGQAHSIQVKYSGTATNLLNTPKTISCTIGSAPGGYAGYLDGANCSVIGGWAWNGNQPNSPVNVDIYDGNNLLATVPANQYRQDLFNAGLGNGYHAFNLTTPSILKDGQQHTIRVKHAGTTTDLSTTPQSFTCSPPPVNFSNALIDPINRTGAPGEDLFSGNYNWSLPILGLAGRAGLDLGLSLSCNSLVWTRTGSSIGFDLDKGFPSAGFRLGFPTIQQQTYTSQSGSTALLMIMPSGSRVELRQVSATLYESADSSWLQLDTSLNPMILRTADGTQLSFQLAGGEYKCTQVKDRNGNYITVAYDGSGHISTAKDTLNRTVTFAYSNNNLQKITQLWNGTEHIWAQFEYNSLTIQTSFSGLSVMGPQNGTSITVLSKVTLDDGSSFSFDYTSYGQVKKISHRAVDDHLLASAAYDMNTSAGQTDCPRFTKRTDYAEDWNNGNTVDTLFTFDRGAGFGQVTLPDGTLVKESHGVAGFRKGLTTQADTFSFDNYTTPKKTVVATLTQDNEAVTNPLNPRVSETNVTDDSSNLRRSTISYSNLTLPNSGTVCKLPSDTREYAADGTTLLRKTHTDYVTTSDYLTQHIIGLVSARYLYDNDSQTATPVSKVTFGYDLSASLSSQGEPVQHDSSYGTSFLTRGNLTSVTRWDVTTLGNQTPQSVTSTMGYNTVGNVISTSDPLGHGVTISYTDSFAATNTTLPTSTLAYPTIVTDPDSKSSNAQYDYDLGVAKVTTDPKTATLTRSYDGAGRVIRIDSNSGGYTRFIYPPSMTEVDTYVLQVAATQTTSAVEIFSAQFSDGAGRVITTRRELPGSTGGYSGQKFVYDVMGRLSQQSNPTEITNAGVPAGDDATAGWLYASQQYDWKGRPTVTTNTDTTTRSISYGGCGCAGGEVVTVRDEVNRRQRMTYDVLGRLMKTEVLNSDLTTYSTTKNTYNVHDQVTFIRQYQGTDTGATFQETAMTYDGYGRLGTRKAPIEDSGSVYAYYADDTVQKVTDPRGASSTFTYNGRHLVTGITYAKPGNSPQPDAITPVPTVTFEYDAAGNRLWMTDGLGRVDYVRDTWSRLTSETRTFNDFPGSTYPLTYDYNLAGELKSLTDPFGKAINYAYNQGGQLTGVTGSNFAGITQYASTMQYRAWGGLKHMVSGDGRSIDIGYSGRLQISSFAPSNNTGHSTYEYYGDGRVSFVHNLDNPSFDRKYSYDHAGRLNNGLSGTDARGEPYDANNPNPYKQTYSYDVFSNMTGRTNRWWTLDEGSNTATYVNDRNTAWDYNAAGNVAHNPEGSYVYDAAGRMSKFNDPLLNQSYDGDGLPALRIENRLNLQDRATIYYIRSSVLAGQTITEVNGQGFKRRTYVYANGEEIARQEKRQTDSVVWISRNPITGDDVWSRDPLGGYIGSEFDALAPDYATVKGDSPTHDGDADPFAPLSGCTLDGAPIDCNNFARLINNGAVSVGSAFGGKTFGDVSHVGIGGVWIGQWTPGQPADDPGDPIYREKWVSYAGLFGGAGAAQNSTQPNQPRTAVPLPNLGAELDATLRRGDCGNFVQNLINQVAKDTGKAFVSDYVPDLFSRISYTLNDISNAGEAHGSIDSGNANAQIGIRTAPASAPASYLLDITDEYTATALHETVHFAASGRGSAYLDWELARALKNLGLMSAQDVGRFNQLDPNNSKHIANFSRLWDKYLGAYCQRDWSRVKAAWHLQ